MYVVCHHKNAYTTYAQCHVQPEKRLIWLRLWIDGSRKGAIATTLSVEACKCKVGACIAHKVVDAMYAMIGEL